MTSPGSRSVSILRRPRCSSQRRCRASDVEPRASPRRSGVSPVPADPDTARGESRVERGPSAMPALDARRGGSLPTAASSPARPAARARILVVRTSPRAMTETDRRSALHAREPRGDRPDPTPRLRRGGVTRACVRVRVIAMGTMPRSEPPSRINSSSGSEPSGGSAKKPASQAFDRKTPTIRARGDERLERDGILRPEIEIASALRSRSAEGLRGSGLRTSGPTPAAEARSPEPGAWSPLMPGSMRAAGSHVS